MGSQRVGHHWATSLTSLTLYTYIQVWLALIKIHIVKPDYEVAVAGGQWVENAGVDDLIWSSYLILLWNTCVENSSFLDA